MAEVHGIKVPPTIARLSLAPKIKGLSLIIQYLKEVDVKGIRKITTQHETVQQKVDKSHDFKVMSSH